jgi:glycosyltransferase involved in cell wall biosynthesis
MSDGRRLKVLTLTDQLIASGGAERVAMQIATGLDRDRFESVYCASRYVAGAEQIPMVAAAERRMDEAGIRYFGLARGSSLNLASWSPLYRALRQERFDVIHAHMFGSNVWGTLVGRLARVPVVVAHEHTWSFEGKPLRRFVDREVIGRFSHVFVAVSRDDERKMIEIEGVDPGKVLFVPNGIPTPPPPSGADVRAELGIPRDAPVIGTVSVLRPQKALDLLIRAALPLLSELPDLRVLIAGAGPEEEKLTDLVSDLGVGDRVLLLGYRADVPDVLAALDVAVSSSSFEGSPLAVMEFMESALPIVATRVGGVPDLIDDGVQGLLVEPGDAEGLGAAVRRMLADREAARAMGERARDRRRAEFDVDLMVRRFESLYERLRAGAGVPASVTELQPARDSSPVT